MHIRCNLWIWLFACFLSDLNPSIATFWMFSSIDFNHAQRMRPPYFPPFFIHLVVLTFVISLFFLTVPPPNRPTTPLGTAAIVPPPRPLSRPKLPAGKLTGINEAVSKENISWFPLNEGLMQWNINQLFSTGSAIQPSQGVQLQPSSCCSSGSCRELLLSKLQHLPECQQHTYCRWGFSLTHLCEH